VANFTLGFLCGIGALLLFVAVVVACAEIYDRWWLATTGFIGYETDPEAEETE